MLIGCLLVLSGKLFYGALASIAVDEINKHGIKGPLKIKKK